MDHQGGLNHPPVVKRPVLVDRQRRVHSGNLQFCGGICVLSPPPFRWLTANNKNCFMSQSQPSPDFPSIDASTGAFEPMAMSSSDPVLGYPATEPASIDLGPIPSGVGAKPSAKSKPAETKPSRSGSKAPPIRKPEKRSGPPLPKRPKGRLFIGTVFLAVIGSIGFTLFDSLLRYTAYGEVTGRRLELAVPWPGVIQSIHVREGDHVEFGQVIATIDNFELKQKIEEIDDSLRLQRAQLSSELAMLRWEAEKIRDLHKLAQSEFYDKWSELLWEQSRLADLQTQLKRIEPILREGAASKEQYDSLQFQVAGQEKRVEQLIEAVRALKKRTDQSPVELDMEDRIQPTLARIENLQAELQRTRDMIQQGDIRAPAGGRIVRTHRFAGEYAEPTTPVVELLVDGSTELVLYLPQSRAEEFPIGRSVTVNVNPANTNVACQVHRVALEMKKAPESLARFYQNDETLLPVYLRVTDWGSTEGELTLGSQLRLPRADNVSVIAKLKRWWTETALPSFTSVDHASQVLEPEPSVQTVSEQEPEHHPADTEQSEIDGRTAGWIREFQKAEQRRMNPARQARALPVTTCVLSAPVICSTVEYESISQRKSESGTVSAN